MKNINTYIHESIFDIDDKSIIDKTSKMPYITITGDLPNNVTKNDVTHFILFIINNMNGINNLKTDIDDTFSWHFVCEHNTWFCCVKSGDETYIVEFKYVKTKRYIDFEIVQQATGDNEIFVHAFVRAMQHINKSELNNAIVKKFCF